MTEAGPKVLHFVAASTRNPLMMDLVRALPIAPARQVIGSLHAEGDLQADARTVGVPVIALAAERRIDYPAATLALAAMLRRQRINVVHAHGTDAALVGLAAAILARTPVRIATRHHAGERLLYAGRRGRMVDAAIGRWLAQILIAPSARAARAAQELDGVPFSRIRVLPNGYDWTRIQPSPGGRARVRAEFGLGDAPVLCAVGRLTWAKGFAVLLRACAQAGLGADVRIMIVGTGPDEEGIRALAAAEGVADRCVFTGHRADVFDVMSASDLLVHASFDEAQCQVLIEAMALGLPIVATLVGAADEIIIPGRSGWLVPPKDVPALAAAIVHALSNPRLRNDFAEAGRRIVIDAYPIQKAAAEHYALYERLLAASRHGPLIGPRRAQGDSRLRAACADPDVHVGVSP